MVDLVVGLSCAGRDEAGGAGCGAAYGGGGSDKLEKIEGNILVTAWSKGGVYCRVHEDPPKAMLSKFTRRRSAALELGDADTDASDDETGWRMRGPETEEIDGVIEGIGPENQPVGVKADIAKSERVGEVHVEEAGPRRLMGNERL
jgi:hypothetical protein